MIDLKQVPDTNIIIVTAKGTITGDDYENCIIPAIEATLKEYDKLRFLHVMAARGIRRIPQYSVSEVWSSPF